MFDMGSGDMGLGDIESDSRFDITRRGRFSCTSALNCESHQSMEPCRATNWRCRLWLNWPSNSCIQSLISIAGMIIICYKQRIILENAVGREKDVQSIDLDSVMKKKRAAFR
jgi:hypothetical protein